jgi:hypothetical protein
MRKILLLTPFLMLIASPAYALRLGNCDDVTHALKVNYYGESIEMVLEPGQRRFVHGVPESIELGGRVIHPMHYDSEWCIWDGKLRIQRRWSHKRE